LLDFAKIIKNTRAIIVDAMENMILKKWEDVFHYLIGNEKSFQDGRI